ncbi:putative acetyltransferase [compost metagenome]
MLEFVKGNTFAQRIYESVGFKIVRELDCLRGTAEKSPVANGVTFREIESVDWDQLKTFFSIQPSWQNNVESVLRAIGKRKTIGCYINNELVGFASFNPDNGRIALMAIAPEHRRKGYGSQLLSYIQQQFDGEVSVFNVDKSHTATHEFLTKRGLQSVVEQYEMVLEL